MKIYTIEIINWEKHNGAKTKGDWFKLDQYFWDDPKIAQLSLSEIGLYIWLLCLASQRRKKQVQFSVNTIPIQLRKGSKSTTKRLAKLSELQLLNFLDKDKERDKERDRALAKSSDSPPPFRHPQSYQEFVEMFSEKIPHWLQLYPNSEWMQREMQKCFQYFYVDGQKAPSASYNGWTRRMKSWLERGWEDFARKNPNATKSQQKKRRAEFKPENFL